MLKVPSDLILDQGENQAQVRALGQEIFNKYHQEDVLDRDGLVILVVTLDWITKNPEESSDQAKLQRKKISTAWEGVGNETHRWIG